MAPPSTAWCSNSWWGSLCCPFVTTATRFLYFCCTSHFTVCTFIRQLFWMGWPAEYVKHILISPAPLFLPPLPHVPPPQVSKHWFFFLYIFLLSLLFQLFSVHKPSPSFIYIIWSSRLGKGWIIKTIRVKGDFKSCSFTSRSTPLDNSVVLVLADTHWWQVTVNRVWYEFKWPQMELCGSIRKQAAVWNLRHFDISTLYSWRYHQNQFVLQTSYLCEKINLSCPLQLTPSFSQVVSRVTFLFHFTSHLLLCSAPNCPERTEDIYCVLFFIYCVYLQVVSFIQQC